MSDAAPTPAARHPYDRPSDPAKRHSAGLTDGPDRAGARAMLKAIGFTDEDLAKPLVGVGTTWIETMPCNYNQRRLAEHVKDGIRAAGGTPMEFNTVSVSDGVSMGTEGMKASLISREVIADSIELVVRGHLLDGVVCLVGCDKTIPAAAMALGRLDCPGVILYNGTIYPGTYKGQRSATVVTVYEAIGAYRAGKITLDELYDIENVACPGPGACGGQYTANTMSHGDGVHGSLARRPQRHPGRGSGQGRGGPTDRRAGDGPRPARRPALHLRHAQVARERDRLAWPRRVARPTASCTCSPSPTSSASRSTSTSSAPSPTARRSSPTCVRAAATPRPTCTRRAAWSSSCASCSSARPAPRRRADRRRPDDRRDRGRGEETPGQQVVVPIETPLKPTGGLAILHGTLAPEGCVVKLAGHERRLHRGPARVFDSETACFEAVKRAPDRARRRRRHPLRGTGRRPGHAGDAERHGALVGEGLGDSRGAAHRRPVLGRDPRADDRPRRARGGARRAHRRRRGRRQIIIDVDRKAVDLDVAADEIARRLAAWTPPAPELPERRAGQVRGPRRVRLAGRGHHRRADDAPTCR